MEGICRGCLINFEDPIDLLQYTEERRRLFVYSTGLQVKRNDAFPFQLCKECYYSLKTSCKFKKMCRTSDRKIKNYLALKDVDDGMDFSTFLKRNEESLFRLPMLSGASTPANQKAKDDDNESTCTSIQNFMTDILRADEIPDSEARIIKEMIEEEADVLEDSLDSHWLEEDVPVDEYRLDMGLSRFSTPRSTNRERINSPNLREATSSDITSGEDYDNIPIDVTFKQFSNPVDNSYTLNNVLEMEVHRDKKKTRCVIDKNLEKALKDENNQEFSLEELLASPVFPSKSGASTPTIEQIIFGNNIKDSKKSKSPKFESDLDLLIGNLDKGIKHQEQLQIGMCDVGKEPKQELHIKNSMKMEKKNVCVEKVPEGKKIDLNDYSAGKILREKLNLTKEKLYQEKKLFKEQLGKLYEEDFDFEHVNDEKAQEAKPNLDNLVEKNDNGLDVNMQVLLEDKDRELAPVIDNNAQDLQLEMLREPAVGYYEEDSDDDILEEFLNTEKEKLANVEMKKKALNDLVKDAQMNDAELTDLLQEAYDYSFDIIEDINPQSPLRGIKFPKKTLSPIENKYCITNFYCKMCDMKYKNLKALKIHFMKRHQYKIKTSNKPWQVRIRMCDLCGQTFTNYKSLVHHLKNHDKPKEYQCKKCELTFKTEHALKNHKVSHKGTPTKTAKNLNSKYVCRICGAISTSSSNQLAHERRHSKVYTLHCEHCGKGFHRNNDLKIHRRHHTGEKPYPCLHCDRSFPRRDSLNRHLKSHRDGKIIRGNTATRNL